MKLLIDLGNSRAKWRTTVAPAATRAEPYRAARLGTKLATWFARLEPAPTAVWVCNVAGDTAAQSIIDWCAENWSLEPRFATSKRRQLGVTNAYAEPTQLGVDRWVALLAAHRYHPGAVCVVDCGTAMTLDVLDAGGRHLGGLITPGLGLMRSSLARKTRGIPDVGDGPAGLFARSTAEGVAAGTLYSAVATIDRVVGDVSAELGEALTCVVTGGEAPAVMPLLGIAATSDADLVLRGLELVARSAR